MLRKSGMRGGGGGRKVVDKSRRFQTYQWNRRAETAVKEIELLIERKLKSQTNPTKIIRVF